MINIEKKILSLKSRRIFIILINTFIYFFIFCFNFIILYLLLPKIFLKIGLSNIISILYVLIFIFIFILVINVVYIPFYGLSFLKKIIKNPYKVDDIISSKKLLLNQEKLSSFSMFLKTSYLSKVNNNIADKIKINKKIFIYFSISIVLFILVIFFKFSFLKDLKFAFLNNIHPRILIYEKEANLEFLIAKIINPSYLENIEEYNFNLLKINTIDLLIGSKVVLEGKTTLNDIKEINLLSSSNGNLSISKCIINKDNIFSGSFLILDNSMFVLEFIIQNDSIKTYKSKLYKVKIIEDKPPVIQIISPDIDFKTSFGAEIPLVLRVTDDFALSEINIYHRELGTSNEFNKSLVSRFRKADTKNYSQTYYWNPVIRLGNKINELIYALNTEKIEYYIEAKDTNSFTNKGVSKTNIRTIIFIDMFSEINSIEEIIIKNLEQSIALNEKIKNKSISDKDINNFDNYLNNSLNLLSGKIENIFNDNSIIENTKDLISKLSIKNQNLTKDLDNYENFLKNYLFLINMFKNSEQTNLVNSELKSIENKIEENLFQDAVERVENLLKFLKEKHEEKLKKINNLIKAGNLSEAKKLMHDLLEEIKNKNNESYQEARENILKMTKMAIKLIQDLMDKAKYLLDQQSAIKDIIIFSDKVKNFTENQKILNKDYKYLYEKTKFLALNYPVFNETLVYFADKSLEFASLTYEYLYKSNKEDAISSQDLVIRYLKEYLKGAEQQKQVYKNIQRGNLERLLSNNLKNSLVLIPKEAIYTIPIDYKKKVIDASKARGSNLNIKDKFWKELIE